jgi:hypothetical protein|tara:strand:+ start:783 stop:1028 length:246 start_codon:yes stop_codon:yes gene_type:complete
MPNVPMNISKVLAEQSANTDITKNHNLNPDAVSKLNYEVMYKMLEGEVEKLILENQGNPLIDDFKTRIVNKFSYLIQKLSS